MIKKTLLTGVYLSSLFSVSMPLQAVQHHTPQTFSPESGQAMGNPHEGGASSNCPPCPCMGGGGTGWVLIPYGAMPPGGTPCEPHPEKHPITTPSQPHNPIHPVEPHHVVPHPEKPQASEEDELEKNLRDVIAKLHCRTNPYNGEIEKEWGKEWQGKVYFKELGLWVSHPVLPEASCAPGNKPTGNVQEPPKEEPPKPTPVDIQDVINKSKPVLMKAGGKNQWGRIYEGKKWIRGGNGMWVSLENEPNGQGNIEEQKTPEKEPIFFSSTNRSYMRGPGTYNPVVPGAHGTPQEKLNPVNRPAAEVSVGE